MSKSYICSLYKRLLSEGSLFFDDRARTFIVNRTKKTFREYKSCQDQERIKHKIKEARRHLHCIEAANRGSYKKAMRILEEAYGRRGKTRHLLLAPYLDNSKSPFPLPEPFVPHAPRTAPPPPLSPPLIILITKDLSKSLEPELPQPLYKPLHPGRKANLLWRYRSLLLDRVQVPLPLEIISELEKKSSFAVANDILHIQQGNAPPWNLFYLNSHVDLSHLSPHHRLIKQSTFQRKIDIKQSPFSFMKPTISDYLSQAVPTVDSIPKLKPFTDRQQRRLYQNLLAKIPLIEGFNGDNMWDLDIKSSKVFRSKWAVHQCKTMMMDDVPIEVIENTLSSKKKSGNKTKLKKPK